jgi:diguanylate cyclase (GGDEF)-like protein
MNVVVDDGWDVERIAREFGQAHLVWAVGPELTELPMPPSIQPRLPDWLSPQFREQLGTFSLDALAALDPLDQGAAGKTYGAIFDQPGNRASYHTVVVDPGAPTVQIPAEVHFINGRPEVQGLFVVINFGPAEPVPETPADDHREVLTILRNRNGIVLEVSPGLCTTLAISPAAMLGVPLIASTHPEDIAMLANDHFRYRDVPGARWKRRFRLRTGQGGWRTFDVVNLNLQNAEEPSPTTPFLLTTCEDVTELVEREESVRVSEEHFKMLSELLPAAVVTMRPDHSDFWANAHFYEMHNVAPDGFDATKWRSLISSQDLDDFDRQLALAHPGSLTSFDYRYLAHDGDWRIANMQIRRTEDAVGLGQLICCIADVTDARRSVAMLRWHEDHDQLTSIANRSAALRILAGHLSDDLLVGTTVLCVDIDDFKGVIDRFGHEVGDLLLKNLAARIETSIRPTDTLARIGGDQFLVICPGLDSRDSATAASKRILSEICAPIRLNGHSLRPSASIGVAIAPAGFEGDAHELLHDVDVAVAEAKHRGRGFVETFTRRVRTRVEERAGLVSDFEDALQRHELVAHYQPVVDAWSGELKGFESLCRWEHPTRGLIAPDVFLPIAASTGNLEVLDREMARVVLSETAEHMPGILAVHPRVQIALNITGPSVANPELAAMLIDTARNCGFAPEWLTVEITESDLIADVDRAVVNLTRLADAHVRIALDDFGVGHSCLTYLRRLPAHYVKIDRSFIHTLDADVSTRIIASSVVDMVHHLGMSVVAEGVENDVQLEEARGIVADSVQGYLIARPMPWSEVLELVKRDDRLIEPDFPDDFTRVDTWRNRSDRP